MVEIHITQRPLHVLDSHAKKPIFHLINAKIKINYNKKTNKNALPLQTRTVSN